VLAKVKFPKNSSAEKMSMFENFTHTSRNNVKFVGVIKTIKVEIRITYKALTVPHII
jgi:hypothetical protein